MTQPVICARCGQPMKRGEYFVYYQPRHSMAVVMERYTVHRSLARCRAGSKEGT